MLAGWEPSHFPPRSLRRRPAPARRPRWTTRGAGAGRGETQDDGGGVTPDGEGGKEREEGKTIKEMIVNKEGRDKSKGTRSQTQKEETGKQMSQRGGKEDRCLSFHLQQLFGQTKGKEEDALIKLKTMVYINNARSS